MSSITPLHPLVNLRLPGEMDSLPPSRVDPRQQTTLTQEISMSPPTRAREDLEVEERVYEALQDEAANALKCFADDGEIRSTFERIRTLIEDVTSARNDITDKNVALIKLRRESTSIKQKKLSREEQNDAIDEIALASRELEDARNQKKVLDVALRTVLCDAILIVSQLARNERLIGNAPSGCVERLAEDVERYVFSKFHE